jgi:CzcA family heavy metal efflux pump
MIDGLIRWSLTNRALVLLGAAAMLAFGAWRASLMPVDVFPDLTAPTVTILTEAHGMAPEEVERLVTLPIETSVNGASGIRRLRSSSGVGISVVWAEFEWGTDIFHARQVVSERMQAARSQIPSELEPPVLAPVTSIMGEILFVAMTSEHHTPMEIRTEADWTVRRRLLAVPGISQVIPIGGDVRQLQVVLSPERLSAHDLAIDEVAHALREASASSSAGFILEGGEELLVHGLGRVATEDDLYATVVARREGRSILVRDIAEVVWGPALKRGTGAFAGEPAVVMGIQKQPGANTLALTEHLDEVLGELAAQLPKGMELHTDIFRQADFIDVAIENVTVSLRDGAILVLVILLLFLGSFRPTVISALAIPLSLVASVLVLDVMGVTLNTMTLGGMAIAVGALVDDAIIDVENVVRRLRENGARPEPRAALVVVFEASREIRASIVFATLIIMLVFVPLFFLSGVEGRLLAPLGVAYLVSLAASLVVALTVTPALCLLLLGRGAETDKEETRFLTWLKARFEPLLALALRRWRAVAAASVALLVAAVVALAAAGQSFLPTFNEGTLTISVVTSPGIALRESNRLARMVDGILLAQPEVKRVARRTGRAELDEHAQGVNASEIDVTLEMKDRSTEAFLAELRRAFTAVPGTNITIGQPISHRIDHMLSGTRANIAVKILGRDLPTLYRVAEQVQAQMGAVRGVVDLSLEQQPSIPFARVRLNRAAVAEHGLSAHDVTEAMDIALAGEKVSMVREGDRRFDVVVRLPRSERESMTRLRDLRVSIPSGGSVPLDALATVVRDAGPGRISRENVQRKVVVMANVAGADVVGVVDDIRRRVSANVPLPAGVHVEYGGQFESAQEAQRTIALLGLLVLLGVFALLLSVLGSARDALLVLLNLPLALIGGVVGVYLSGAVVSVATLIGFVTLFGVATRNGLMLVTHIQHLVTEEGVTDPREAVRRGALERLAPVLMTALASALALVPLALRAGEPGAEIQSPMAIVILCGLVTSTALNMLVVPALYLPYGRATRTLRAGHIRTRTPGEH